MLDDPPSKDRVPFVTAAVGNDCRRRASENRSGSSNSL